MSLDWLLPKALHSNWIQRHRACLLVSPLGILVAWTIPVRPNTAWRKQSSRRGWYREAIFRFEDAPTGPKPPHLPLIVLHQSRKQEEMQSKCRYLGKGMSRILTTFPPICCQRRTQAAKWWGLVPDPLRVTGPCIFPASHTPGLREYIPQNWEEEPSSLPPGPLKTTRRGLADLAKDCHRRLAQETRNAVYSFSGWGSSNLKRESLF